MWTSLTRLIMNCLVPHSLEMLPDSQSYSSTLCLFMQPSICNFLRPHQCLGLCVWEMLFKLWHSLCEDVRHRDSYRWWEFFWVCCPCSSGWWLLLSRRLLLMKTWVNDAMHPEDRARCSSSMLVLMGGVGVQSCHFKNPGWSCSSWV